MANLTLATLRARVQGLIPDNAISDARVNNAIQVAHEVFPMDFFVDHTDEASVTLLTDTWEYALPETSSVSTFVTIHEVKRESSTAGIFEDIIPDHLWRVDYDGSGVWNLVFDRKLEIVPSRKIRIKGQKRYTTPSADGDVITLHNGWVIQYVLGLLHAAQGGSSSDMATWHQRMASFHMEEAQKIEDNINNRAYPGSKLVPGAI